MKNFSYSKIFKFQILQILIAVLLFSSINLQAQNRPPKKLDSYEFKLLPSPLPQTDDPYIVIKNDFFLTLRDNMKMDCSKFYPNVGNIYLPNGYPVVVMVHGYGDRKETLENFAFAQSQYNYVVYTYSVRGQGNSEGLSNLISMTEAEDLMEFVNYIKVDNVGGDSSKIMIMGGSQGGTLPYMAASNGMNVAGIISALSSPKFASSWMENGCAKMTLLWSIEYTPDTVRYNSTVNAMSDWIYASGVKSDKWDSLEYYMPLGRDFMDKVQYNQVPILIENSWQDYFFNARNGIESLPLQFPFRIYFGAVMGHGGDISESENQWHMNFFNEWFYYYIWGIDNNLPNRPKFHYALTTYPWTTNGMWSFVHDSSSVWPPENVNGIKFYINKKNKKLSLTSSGKDKDQVNFKNDVKKNYTLQTAVYSEFTGSEFNKNFKKKELVYDTEPFTSEVQLIGTPKVHLDYESDKDICQYNFQIYEVKADNTIHLINRANYTDRYYTKKDRRTKDIEGLSFAHQFSAGSKLRLIVTNLDTSPDDFDFLNTNPHVLPVMEKSTNKIYTKNTYIELPLKGFTSDYFIAGNEPEVKLYQNYPNPFNPTTNIKFEIPKDYNGLVTLNIYDITGREIAKLVNQNLTTGQYNVSWNANNFATGIYFYKLDAGDFSEVKRMILIK
ncbi:MAG: T9SS type A sorting domain-containing protein [Ignavibacteria bacterium]|nr:T9SS type A sorting domain-containing protein [Ignavibacteria bacterium]